MNGLNIADDGIGFSLALSGGISRTWTEVVTPGYTRQDTIYEDVYGPITTTRQEWVETYDWIPTSYWVEDYGMVTHTGYRDPIYDDEGNVIEPGGSYEYQDWGITGGHYESGQYWGVSGGYYQDISEQTTGVIGTQTVVTDVWVPEQRTSQLETSYGTPIVNFTANTSDTVWRWKDSTGLVMLDVSSAGIVVPKPFDTQGNHKALFTSTTFEQSYSKGSLSGPHNHEGANLQQGGVAVWHKFNDGTGGIADSSDLRAHELIIGTSKTVDANQIRSTRTRIAAENSEFGGDVKIKGKLLISPQGDLSMGDFTVGDRP
jgi:hypothetical protein